MEHDGTHSPIVMMVLPALKDNLEPTGRCSHGLTLTKGQAEFSHDEEGFNKRNTGA